MNNRILSLADAARTPDEAMRVVQEIREARGDDRRARPASSDGLPYRLLKHGMKGSRCQELGIDPRILDRLCSPLEGGQFVFPPPTCFITTTDGLLVAPTLEVTDRVQFTSVAALGGIIVGLMGQVLDNATGLAVATGPDCCSLRLRVNAGGISGGNLVTNGQVETFLGMGSLLRSTSPYSPFLRWVDCRDTIDVVFRSNVVGGGITLRPQLVFAIAGVE